MQRTLVFAVVSLTACELKLDDPAGTQTSRAALSTDCTYDGGVYPSGTPCGFSNPCLSRGTCDGVGNCTATPFPNGTACDAGSCNNAGACTNGSCVATPRANGSVCDDGNSCTGPD